MYNIGGMVMVFDQAYVEDLMHDETIFNCKKRNSINRLFDVV